MDVNKHYLEDGKAVLTNEGKSDCKLCTKLDTADIVKKVGDQVDGPKVKHSETIESFLCGYIYLKSLDMNSERTLFVHIPQNSELRSTTKAILEIIKACLHQLNEKKQNNENI